MIRVSTRMGSAKAAAYATTCVPHREGRAFARKLYPRQVVDDAWGEEHKRVPAGAPGVTEVGRSLDDEEITALPRKVVADCEAGLSRADDQDVVVLVQTMRSEQLDVVPTT